MVSTLSPARSIATPSVTDAVGDILLRVDAVEKSYGTLRALDGVSLLVKSSERIAMLGPNGAGKTTLVRAISGRLRRDAGRVELAGVPIDNRGALNRLGVVPQDLAIYSDLTTRENLMMFGKLHGLAGRDLKDRVAWALDWIGLDDRAHHLTRTFSGGMKRRVNIACGVLHRPSLLLLDEPTVGVDPQSRQRIFDMLAHLHRDGTTIILTTHHLDEVESQCDRIVILDKGRVIADGSIEDVIEQTTGQERRVNMTIKGNFQPRIDGLRWDERRDCWTAALYDIATELPGLLDAVRACGGNVAKLEVHEPSLHEVFLHLTGRELRE